MTSRGRYARVVDGTSQEKTQLGARITPESVASSFTKVVLAVSLLISLALNVFLLVQPHVSTPSTAALPATGTPLTGDSLSK